MHSSGLGCGPLRNWSAAFYQMSTSINQSTVWCVEFSVLVLASDLGVFCCQCCVLSIVATKLFLVGDWLHDSSSVFDCERTSEFSWVWLCDQKTMPPRSGKYSCQRLSSGMESGWFAGHKFWRRGRVFLCKRRVNDASNAFFVLEHMFRFDFNIYRFRDSNWLKSIDIDWRIDSMFAR